MACGFRLDLVDLVAKLGRFASSLTGSRSEADDLVQAACERALKHADRFEPGTRMDSRIVQNLWLDAHRRRRVQGASVDPATAALSDEGRASRRAEEQLMLEGVRRAMATLPQGRRVVPALVAVERLSDREAAAVLDIPIGTVMSRPARARGADRPHGRARRPRRRGARRPAWLRGAGRRVGVAARRRPAIKRHALIGPP